MQNIQVSIMVSQWILNKPWVFCFTTQRTKTLMSLNVIQVAVMLITYTTASDLWQHSHSYLYMYMALLFICPRGNILLFSNKK